jgi:molecular chaperone GrpE (heat shock protein)
MAVACWRLQQTLQTAVELPSEVVVRHATRSLAEALGAMGLQIIDLRGRVYDPGLAPEVVDVLREEGADEATAIVLETVIPTLEYQGRVVRPGQIVVSYSKSAATEDRTQ